ncbi:MAG: hypothetical protein UX77_C0021G0012 [Parcubacteria group bacterium GW2011_GWA1_47_11]|nr:MAG: hypothetical protein UX77_C0021G0012 [Parcubacteria group bacterium GW2011_GWA1_47_11]
MLKNQETRLKYFFIPLLLVILAGAPLLRAAELVNINTADLATLETLNGIGPSKAQAIIDYRTQNGPFAKIEDIMNVSGIGTATFNNIKDFITVGGAGTTQTTTATTTSSTQEQTQQAEVPQGSAAGPPTLTVRITTDERATAGAGSYFSATAYGTEGLPLPNPRFIWNFGDGAAAEGARVFHTFAYPGRYAVSVTAAYNYSAGVARTVVEAASAAVSLEAEGDGSLLLHNNSSKEANIGLWSLVDGGKSYVIPEDTIILAGEGVRFAASVTGLAGSRAAVLLYPNSAPAAAASVAAGSPLRGERVVAKPPSIISTPPQAASAGEVSGESTAAPSTGENSGSPALWGSLAALAGLLVVGGTAAHYLRPRFTSKETPLTAEEFDIE